MSPSIEKETPTLERAGQKNYSEETLGNPILSFAKKFSSSKCVSLYRKQLRTLKRAGQKKQTSFSFSQNLTLSVQKETSTLEREGQKNRSEQTIANPVFSKVFFYQKLNVISFLIIDNLDN